MTTSVTSIQNRTLRRMARDGVSLRRNIFLSYARTACYDLKAAYRLAYKAADNIFR